jgi:F0F1-type ATP synthase membrane subunit b/b'
MSRRWHFICVTSREAWIVCWHTRKGQLKEAQRAALKSELDAGATHEQLFAELEEALRRSAERVCALASADLQAPRAVGKKQLPSTVGGLLVHIAEHTQRHVSQAITMAKIVASHS